MPRSAPPLLLPSPAGARHCWQQWQQCWQCQSVRGMPSVVCGGADNDTVGQDCNPGPGWLESALRCRRRSKAECGENTAGVVWDDLKRFRLSRTARQVVSEDTSRVVWDDLKRFKLSRTARHVVSEAPELFCHFWQGASRD